MLPATIRTRLAVSLSAMVLLATVEFAGAQTPTTAALQARARMQQRHKQSGSIGNGYRPFSAWTYQNSARTHAQTLNAYGQNCKQLPPATAKEHLDEIRRNVASSKAEIAKLGADATKEADVKQEVDALTKHLAECEKLCGLMDTTIDKDSVENAKMCAHCSGLETKLKAAEMEHQALLKKLGIELPATSGKRDEHQHGKGASTGTKKK